jgi:hypothetical protein
MRRRIRRRVVLRCSGHLHPKALTRPSPKVDVFTALAAKRARWVGGCVDAVAAALGAGDDARFKRLWWLRCGHGNNSNGSSVEKARCKA